MIIIGSCQDKAPELTYFRNMTHYPKFDSVKDRSKLFGFDRVVLYPTHNKINNIPCWYLSSPVDADFNIRGYIWKEKSVIYIKTIEKESADFIKAKKQILFDFGNVDSLWSVDYKRGNGHLPYYLEIEQVGRYMGYVKNDTIIAFDVKQNLINLSTSLSKFTIQVSLRNGFTVVMYTNWEQGTDTYISLFPKPKLTKRRVRPEKRLDL